MPHPNGNLSVNGPTEETRLLSSRPLLNSTSRYYQAALVDRILMVMATCGLGPEDTVYATRQKPLPIALSQLSDFEIFEIRLRTLHEITNKIYQVLPESPSSSPSSARKEAASAAATQSGAGLASILLGYYTEVFDPFVEITDVNIALTKKTKNFSLPSSSMEDSFALLTSPESNIDNRNASYQELESRLTEALRNDPLRQQAINTAIKDHVTVMLQRDQSDIYLLFVQSLTLQQRADFKRAIEHQLEHNPLALYLTTIKIFFRKFDRSLLVQNLHSSPPKQTLQVTVLAKQIAHALQLGGYQLAVNTLNIRAFIKVLGLIGVEITNPWVAFAMIVGISILDWRRLEEVNLFNIFAKNKRTVPRPLVGQAQRGMVKLQNFAAMRNDDLSGDDIEAAITASAGPGDNTSSSHFWFRRISSWLSIVIETLAAMANEWLMLQIIEDIWHNKDNYQGRAPEKYILAAFTAIFILIFKILFYSNRNRCLNRLSARSRNVLSGIIASIYALFATLPTFGPLINSLIIDYFTDETIGGDRNADIARLSLTAFGIFGWLFAAFPKSNARALLHMHSQSGSVAPMDPQSCLRKFAGIFVALTGAGVSAAALATGAGQYLSQLAIAGDAGRSAIIPDYNEQALSATSYGGMMLSLFIILFLCIFPLLYTFFRL